MQEALKELRAILENEKSVYGELLLLAERQKEALIAREIDTLTEIATRQGKLMSQAGRVERKGKEALSNLSSLLGINGPEPALAEVLNNLEESQAKPLKALRDQIFQAAARLAQINKINAELFENALQAIQFTIRLLAGSQQAPEPCYPITESPRQLTSVLMDQLA